MPAMGRGCLFDRQKELSYHIPFDEAGWIKAGKKRDPVARLFAHLNLEWCR